jgi:hypothetical protein
MTYSRKYNFQPGTKISSNQVDEEFDNVIAAANELEADLNSRYSNSQMDSIFAKKEQGDWIPLVLQNGWIYYGSGSTPAYKKDNMGRVQVKGLIKNGTSAAGTTIATLPVGYRPKETKYLLGDDGNLAIKRIQVNVNGTIVIPETVSNAFLILDGVYFFAEQ